MTCQELRKDQRDRIDKENQLDIENVSFSVGGVFVIGVT